MISRATPTTCPASTTTSITSTRCSGPSRRSFDNNLDLEKAYDYMSLCTNLTSDQRWKSKKDIVRTYIPGDICLHEVRTMSAQHLTRDICLFQGGHAHMQSVLLVMKPSNGRGWPKRGVTSTRSSPSTTTLLCSGFWRHVCFATVKKTYIPREMLCGHSADTYLQGYMSALNPSSVFSSG